MFYDDYAVLCALKGVSCKQAAIDAGISHSAPAKWKATGAVPNGETLQKLSAYFHVSVDQLLGNRPIADEDGNTADYLKEILARPEIRRLFEASRHASREQIENMISLMESFTWR